LAALLAACTDATGIDGEADDGTGPSPDPDTAGRVVYTVASALAANLADHDVASDYVWDGSTVVPVTFAGSSISASGSGVAVSGRTATITAAGNYSFTGTLTDGRIIVNTDDSGVVRLILNGTDISSASNSPITVTQAERVLLVLADGTENVVTDANTYSLPSGEDEPNAAVFSKADLTVSGNGSLTVKGSYNDGIASKDGLIISSGTISVNAVDDGIRGKDYLVMRGGTINVTAGGDGLKSDNEDDARAGYIYIAGGNLDITAGADALEAESDLLIANGDFTIKSGGGSTRTVTGDASAKALKASVLLVIEDGSFAIDAADDAVHANKRVGINGGLFQIATGDDAIHADSTLAFNDGRVTISRCYEGLESHALIISGGNIQLTASDDGLNAADGSGGGFPGGPGFPGGSLSGGSNYLHMLGGYVAINATGDGMDINGSVIMTGGTILIHGPTRQDNSAVDYDGSFTISDGLLVGAGSAGMAQAPGGSSSQYSLLFSGSTTRPAGTVFHIQTADGQDVLTFQPGKQYQSIAFSSPALKKGTTYQLYLGGSASGSAADGLYSGGYSPGTKLGEFTVSNVSTRIAF